MGAFLGESLVLCRSGIGHVRPGGRPWVEDSTTVRSSAAACANTLAILSRIWRREGESRAGQGRAGPGREGQGRDGWTLKSFDAGKESWEAHWH